MYIDRKRNISSTSPFEMDLSCNIRIEVNVAMRLGELILTSRTEDKQLMALGHMLANSMTNLLDKLDDKQFDVLSNYLDDSYNDKTYSNKATDILKNQ